MKNDKTIKAVVAGLRWAAEALEKGEIECTYISHEDLFIDAPLGGVADSGIREFKIKYKYIIEERNALKEIFQ